VKIVATLPPMHPGEMLREEFLKPMDLTPHKVAKACGVPRTRIERIVREELGITADTALRLAKFIGTTVGFWMNLQARYDIRTAERAIAADLAANQDIQASGCLRRQVSRLRAMSSGVMLRCPCGIRAASGNRRAQQA